MPSKKTARKVRIKKPENFTQLDEAFILGETRIVSIPGYSYPVYISIYQGSVYLSRRWYNYLKELNLGPDVYFDMMQEIISQIIQEPVYNDGYPV